MNSTRRFKLIAQGVLLAFGATSAAVAVAAETQKVDVYKSPTCGCCTLWVDHMKQAGFRVEAHDANNVAPYRERFGVPDSMASCHTAVVGGYARGTCRRSTSSGCCARSPRRRESPFRGWSRVPRAWSRAAARTRTRRCSSPRTAAPRSSLRTEVPSDRMRPLNHTKLIALWR